MKGPRGQAERARQNQAARKQTRNNDTRGGKGRRKQPDRSGGEAGRQVEEKGADRRWSSRERGGVGVGVVGVGGWCVSAVGEQVMDEDEKWRKRNDREQNKNEGETTKGGRTTLKQETNNTKRNKDERRTTTEHKTLTRVSAPARRLDRATRVPYLRRSEPRCPLPRRSAPREPRRPWEGRRPRRPWGSANER